jgi:hypothetical protein
MSKRLFALLSVLVVGSMALAACGGGPAAPVTEAPVPVTEAPAAGFTCTDAIGMRPWVLTPAMVLKSPST